MERRFNLRTIRCSNLNTAFQIIKPRFSIFAQTGLKSIIALTNAFLLCSSKAKEMKED